MDRVLTVPGKSEPLEEVLMIGESEDSPVVGGPGWLTLGGEGQIYVADYQASQIYEYTADGDYVRSIGSPGDAPGEFQIPVMMHSFTDSLYVYDNRTYRISVFDEATGTFQRSQQANYSDVRPYQLLGVGPNGLAVSYSQSPSILGEGEIGQDEIRLIPHGAGDASSAPILWRTPGVEWLPMDVNGFTGFRVKPLGKQSYCAFLDDRGYCAHTASVAVNIFSDSGDSLRAVSVPTEPRPVTAADREAAVANIPSEAVREQLVIADTHPEFRGPMVVDDDGRIWLRRKSEADATEYWILDPDGNSGQSVTLPGGSVVYDVRGDRVAAQVAHDDGLRRTHVFAVPTTVDS